MKRDLSNLIGCLFIGSILFTSCAEVVLDSVSGKEPDSHERSINFGVEKNQTRGVQLTNGTLTQIGVFASRNKESYNPEQATNGFMYNQLVEKKEDVWRYSPIKYWPGGDESLSFFAYAPYVNNPDVLSFSPKTEPGLPRFTYNVPQNVADQIDFLVAEPKFDCYYPTTSTVDFRFAHMLSCIDFSASLAQNFPSEGTMKVLQIIVAGLSTKGILTIFPLPDTHYEWTLDEKAKTEFTFSTKNGLLDNQMLTKTPQQLTNSENKFMSIPQSLSAQARLIIRAEFSKAGETKEIAFENPITLAEFLPGKRYVLNMVLNVTEIQVDFEVNDWFEYTVEIPPFN